MGCLASTVVLATLLCLSPRHAAAQGYTEGAAGSVGVRLDAHVNLGWYRNAAIGLRADILLTRDGLLDGTDDDLALSPGVEFLYFYHNDYEGFGIFPLLALQWNIYVHRRWSLAPEIGAAMLFGPHRDRYWSTFIAPFFGFGVRYHLNTRNALLFRITWPSGFQFGITF